MAPHSPPESNEHGAPPFVSPRWGERRWHGGKVTRASPWPGEFDPVGVGNTVPYRRAVLAEDAPRRRQEATRGARSLRPCGAASYAGRQTRYRVASQAGANIGCNSACLRIAQFSAKGWLSGNVGCPSTRAANACFATCKGTDVLYHVALRPPFCFLALRSSDAFPTPLQNKHDGHPGSECIVY